MKSIYNIYESILDDIETTMANGANDVIIDMLFSKDIYKRRKGFDALLSLVESHHPKRHTTTAKIKNSDSYFVEFTRPLKIENGLARDICDWIGYIQICKRTGLDYRTACINASEGSWGDKINVYEMNWTFTRANLNPKASNTKLYEVPEELNDLFRQIQMEAYNHR